MLEHASPSSCEAQPVGPLRTACEQAREEGLNIQGAKHAPLQSRLPFTAAECATRPQQAMVLTGT